MSRSAVATAVVAVALVVFSGCYNGPSGCVPPRSARQVALDAPTAAGAGDPLRVLVTDALTGSPIAGAAVVLVWNRDYIEPPGDGDDSYRFPDNPPLSYLDLRTGPDGVATVSFPDERFWILAAAADGYTEEWSKSQRPFSPRDRHEIPLFPARMHFADQATFRPPPPGVFGDGNWQPVRFEFPQAAGSLDGLGQRFLRAEVWLNATWPPQTVGNIGLMAEAGSARGMNRTDVLTEPGPVRLHVDLDEAQEFPVDGIDAGPYTSMGVVGLAGIEFTVEAVAYFEHRERAIARCGVLLADAPLEPADLSASVPGLGVWLLVALGAAVLVARRWRE